jgi:ADP-ribose pyrophosphatase YjhB (NUDIX family)
MTPQAPSTTQLDDAIATLRAATGSARKGLPEPVFLLTSSLTPLLNVDLLISNEQGQTLLTWRHDAFYGPGWHVPGGIVRFKERFEDRIAAVAHSELGVEVDADPQPLNIQQIFHPERDVRGHFVSFLFRCQLRSEPDPTRQFRTQAARHGDWAWHQGCPPNLISQHEIYRHYLEKVGA